MCCTRHFDHVHLQGVGVKSVPLPPPPTHSAPHNMMVFCWDDAPEAPQALPRGETAVTRAPGARHCSRRRISPAAMPCGKTAGGLAARARCTLGRREAGSCGAVRQNINLQSCKQLRDRRPPTRRARLARSSTLDARGLAPARGVGRPAHDRGCVTTSATRREYPAECP